MNTEQIVTTLLNEDRHLTLTGSAAGQPLCGGAKTEPGLHAMYVPEKDIKAGVCGGDKLCSECCAIWLETEDENEVRALNQD